MLALQRRNKLFDAGIPENSSRPRSRIRPIATTKTKAPFCIAATASAMPAAVPFHGPAQF